VLFLKGHGYLQTVYALAFSPDGKDLASCGLDGNVRLWDLGTGKQKEELKANYDAHSVCYSPDRRSFAWPDYYGVQVRDLGSGDTKSYPLTTPDSRIQTATFSGDSRTLFCKRRSWNARSASLCLFDSASGKWEDLPQGEQCTDAVAVSRDGRTLATGHQVARAGTTARSSRRHDHVVRLWDVKGRTVSATLAGHGSQITTVAFSPDGRHLAVTSGTALWVWDLTARQAVSQVRIDKLHFKSVAFSPDGRWLAAARNDKTVRFFDTRTWGEGPGFDWKIGPAVVVAFAQDGMRAAAGSSKGKIVVWDVDV